jgi:hypothetical protein
LNFPSAAISPEDNPGWEKHQNPLDAREILFIRFREVVAVFVSGKNFHEVVGG